MLKRVLFLLFTIVIGLNANSQNADEYFDKACWLIVEGNYNKAIKYFNKTIEADKDFFYAYLNRASAFTLQGKYKKAIKDLDVFLKHEPNNTAALESRGILNVEEGNYSDAIRDLQKLIELKPDFTYIHFYLGLAYYNLNDFANAIVHFDLHLVNNIYDWESLYYKSLCNKASGSIDESCYQVKKSFEHFQDCDFCQDKKYRKNRIEIEKLKKEVCN